MAPSGPAAPIPSVEPPPAQWTGLRRAGIVLALSFPVTGVVLWALVASIVGEDHLEGDDAWPLVGPALFWVPLVVGLVLVAWSATDRPTPGPRTVAAIAIALGLAMTVAGLVGVVTGPAGDANIGGALLLLLGPLVVIGGVATARRA